MVHLTSIASKVNLHDSFQLVLCDRCLWGLHPVCVYIDTYIYTGAYIRYVYIYMMIYCNLCVCTSFMLGSQILASAEHGCNTLTGRSMATSFAQRSVRAALIPMKSTQIARQLKCLKGPPHIPPGSILAIVQAWIVGQGIMYTPCKLSTSH